MDGCVGDQGEDKSRVIYVGVGLSGEHGPEVPVGDGVPEGGELQVGEVVDCEDAVEGWVDREVVAADEYAVSEQEEEGWVAGELIVASRAPGVLFAMLGSGCTVAEVGREGVGVVEEQGTQDWLVGNAECGQSVVRPHRNYAVSLTALYADDLILGELDPEH